MVLDQAQPFGLFRREGGGALRVVAEYPFLEAAVHLFGERFQFVVQPEGEAHQRDQVGELAAGVAAADAGALHAGVGGPQSFVGEQQGRA